jgi:hypothetical protein
MSYIVSGGIFTDTTFKEVQPGTEESYGPFETHEEAIEAWRTGMFNQKLDICTHRLLITELKSTSAKELKKRIFKNAD